jgi:hypothetical protein
LGWRNNILSALIEGEVMSKDDENMLSHAFILWGMSEVEGKEAYHGEYAEQSFIVKMFRKKFEVFNIDIVLPEGSLMVIDICTSGNPGMSQVIVKEILENIPNLKAGHTVTTEDFARVHAMRFPTLSDPRVMEKYEKLWIDQKSRGNNRVDTPEYWLEIFKTNSSEAPKEPDTSDSPDPWDGIV